MKNILKYITLSFVAVFSLTGCYERYVTYSDAEYVMFADTMAVYPVQKDDSTFVIPVVSTVKKDYDRTFGVEVIDKGNNAIEMKHYRLESNTITIKAGENRADVLVHGYYNNIEATDSLGFELSLVMNDKLVMPVYGKSTKAVLMKSCPFNIDDFTGYSHQCSSISIALQAHIRDSSRLRRLMRIPSFARTGLLTDTISA